MQRGMVPGLLGGGDLGSAQLISLPIQSQMLQDPNRTILGKAQTEFVKTQLSAGQATQQWKLLHQQARMQLIRILTLHAACMHAICGDCPHPIPGESAPPTNWLMNAGAVHPPL